MPRSYRLGKREAAVRATRDRVVAAARALIVESGFERASLEDIARRADVNRTTLYHQFGSKRGLLDAVLTDALHRAGLADVAAAVQQTDARDALHASLQAATRLWAAEQDIFRRIMGLAAVDPEIHEVVARRDAERLGAQQSLATRLAEQGYLRPGYPVERTYTVLCLLSGFATFDALNAAGVHSTEAIAATLLDLAGVILDERPPGG